MAKIIILNGAPGCGKDTLADFFYDRALVDDYHSFKAPMFEIARVVLGSKYDAFKKLYDNRDTKEQKAPMLNNLSPREFLIFISESFVKPAVGKYQFGVLAGEQISGTDEVVVMSDGGFPDEIAALAETVWYPNGPGFDGHHNIHIVRLHREGCTFEGDSRNFIYMNGAYTNVIEHDITLVTGDIIKGAKDILRAVGYDDEYLVF